ncbi:MAG: xanthine dehydrogenase family protein subunit M [Ilumatobacter sp.]|jgi:carbon-monoxide dehydrogenase medium subunit|uniref:FAD binding domain-containing protein n=1 Tax=Ilumatobacter sp. TaxID=1967498 RepID=UPI001D4F4E92|nr:xanthine dehydrogenase family protein subunit M [Ilumatobacter sp.]MBT5277956.1 xanthine dehydrogenase family protein subunit M [Ilumatobacter sp.]MBT5554437.1 xanthine dehydrogenase family protein subunit M [Ilumatobacter sp.]MBT5864684.1 xanthine dehydrogenase family protein subunit M [Ilumatobacter sp.]MBT7430643.1 xanthine dehydrogenase family protein subunit M [Ilumatobacter sp.]
MYPSRFNYEAPTSLAEAIQILRSTDDAKVLAGGQSLIPMMKLRFASPATLVDINNIPGLDLHGADADGTYRIGALCRHAQLEKSTTLGDHQPTIAAAAPLVADPIVRTRGTFVGSVCHADPQGDWASCMVALDGSVTAVGPNGSRSIPVKELVSGPFQTILSRDEIATEAVIEPAQGTRVGGYLKLERRVGDFATAGVAIALEMSGDSVTKAGIGLTGVGSQTVDASDAAAALVGSRLDAESIANAARLAAEISKPRSDHRGSADYKRHVVSTFVSRILANVQRSEQQVA